MTSEVVNVDCLVESIIVLNCDTEYSTISSTELITNNENINDKSYIISDADEELLILIEFRHKVNLQSMKIYSLQPIDTADIDVSAPKKMNIYGVNNLNINFNDINTLIPHREIILNVKKLQKGQNIKLEKAALNFRNTRYLAIYIKSNQNDTEKTSINALSFKGIIHQKNIMTTHHISDIICNKCSKYTKKIMSPLNKNQIIRKISHSMDGNVHSFIWILESPSDIKIFKKAKFGDNLVPFRSNYHCIDGCILYFELTPNGWQATDNNIGQTFEGDTNVWLVMHSLPADKQNVRVRFQCTCTDLSFIGENHLTLIAANKQIANCQETMTGYWSMSTRGSMKHSKLKHLNKLTFRLDVTLNAKQFKPATNDNNLLEEIRKKASLETELFQIPSCDKDNIKQCENVQLLLDSMGKHTNNESANRDTKSQIIDAFHHCLLHHDSTKEFEYIMFNIGSCDIQKCNIFKRQYRDRGSDQISVNQSILDRVHCYYQHSVDIGYRVTSKNNDDVKEVEENEENDNKDEQPITIKEQRDKQIVTENKVNDDIDDKKDDAMSLINHSFLKLKQLQMRRNIDVSLICSRYDRFNQFTLSVNNEHKSSDIHSNASESKENVNNDSQNIYRFGQQFFYEDKGQYHQNVLPKYQSLKEELTQNHISRINIIQFMHEFEKAYIHFNSVHRRQNYPKLMLHGILSLMIYCNCDRLQAEFSKTCYDIHQIHRHNEFYHLAYHLTKAINLCGRKVSVSGGTKFYHGINNANLLCQHLVGPKLGIQIDSPLSTTTSMAAAQQFSTNNGLIIEFGGPNVSIECDGYSTSYFPTEWLSDHPKEKENLFMRTMTGLYINEIIEVNDGITYRPIIDALKAIEMIMTSVSNLKYSFLIKEKRRQQLVKVIIEDQLSTKIMGYKPFLSIKQYGKKLMNKFCADKKVIHIQYDEEYDFVTNYFDDDINAIQVMFPNVEHIAIYGNLEEIYTFWEWKEYNDKPDISRNDKWHRYSLHITDLLNKMEIGETDMDKQNYIGYEFHKESDDSAIERNTKTDVRKTVHRVKQGIIDNILDVLRNKYNKDKHCRLETVALYPMKTCNIEKAINDEKNKELCKHIGYCIKKFDDEKAILLKPSNMKDPIIFNGGYYDALRQFMHIESK